MKNTRLIAVLIASQLALPSTYIFAAEGTKAPAPVAKIGATVLTEEDLRKDMGMSVYEAENQLYQIKKGWVDQKAKVVLMNEAAKEAGLSYSEWQKREIDAKVSPPSMQEIDQLATRISASRDGTAPTDAQYAAAKEKAKSQILQQRRAQQENVVYQQLLQKSTLVELFFTKPEAPIVNVTIASDDPVKGPKSAPITMIEFTDFQCPYCKRSQDTIRQILQTYGDKVKFIEKQFPLPGHARAKPAAEAALCAKEQGKFWEMHDLLFANQSMEDADITRFAGEIGLNMKKFDSCYTSHKMSDRVDKDVAEGQRNGVRGTPYFFVNGRGINGAQHFDTFKAIIDEELAKKKS